MFTEEVVASNKSLFAEFNPAADRVDTLLHEQMSQDNSYKNIWELCRKLLLLSHGQGSVERGFSVNRQIEIENMKEGTFVAKRHICDHLKAVGGIDKVIINKDLMVAAAAARQRYMVYLDDEQQKKEEKTKGEKRKLINDEIEELKRKKQKLMTDGDSLEESANEMAEKAEKASNFQLQSSLIAKSNSHRASARDKRKKMRKVQKKLEEKQTELKNM